MSDRRTIVLSAITSWFDAPNTARLLPPRPSGAPPAVASVSYTSRGLFGRDALGGDWEGLHPERYATRLSIARRVFDDLPAHFGRGLSYVPADPRGYDVVALLMQLQFEKIEPDVLELNQLVDPDLDLIRVAVNWLARWKAVLDYQVHERLLRDCQGPTGRVEKGRVVQRLAGLVEAGVCQFRYDRYAGTGEKSDLEEAAAFCGAVRDEWGDDVRYVLTGGLDADRMPECAWFFNEFPRALISGCTRLRDSHDRYDPVKGAAFIAAAWQHMPRGAGTR